VVNVNILGDLLTLEKENFENKNHSYVSLRQKGLVRSHTNLMCHIAKRKEVI